MHVTLAALVANDFKISDWLLAIFTLMLVIVAYMQYKFAQRQDKHFRANERAWILADLTWGNEPRVLEGTMRLGITSEFPVTELAVELTCRNVGKSPAWITNVRSQGMVCKTMQDLVPNKNQLRAHGTMRTLGPEEESSRRFHISGDGTIPKGCYISLYVLVEYRDVFTRPRETRLSYFYDPQMPQHLQLHEELRERNRNT